MWVVIEEEFPKTSTYTLKREDSVLKLHNGTEHKSHSRNAGGGGKGLLSSLNSDIAAVPED